MRKPCYVSDFFWGVREPEKFNPTINAFVGALADQGGVVASDNLVTFGRTLSFTRDEALVRAFNAHAKSRSERGILWRTATLAWAARRATQLGAAYVECGCYRGTTARILLDVADFSTAGAHLYDLFEHQAGDLHTPMPDHGPDLFTKVKERFAEFPFVTVTKGRVPESLSNAPERIGLLHIDMNNREAEVGALESLFDKVVAGGTIILDDYGSLLYLDQHKAEIDWFSRRGYGVLELPTGQGLVIR